MANHADDPLGRRFSKGIFLVGLVVVIGLVMVAMAKVDALTPNEALEPVDAQVSLKPSDLVVS